MKGLEVLLMCCLTVCSFAQEDGKDKNKNEGSTRFFNPGAGGFVGVSPGFGGGLTAGFGGGLNPGFGAGIGPVIGGGINPAIGGGINPVIGGGINPALGGGINPALGGVVGGGLSQTCRRWCRTPQGQAYCCESNNEPDTIPFVKPGQCPPVRPVCPPVRSFAPPQTCSNDSKCGGVDKCCFDTCLQEHVCKPPVGSGGFGFGR